jgi:8-hydroxy-5-deazaflavin:NADPH oxidoreductase
MKVGIIGSGAVGTTLAAGFINHGHDVTIGTREVSKLTEFVKANPKVKIGTFEQAAKFGEVLVLSVKGSVAENALSLAGAANLAGKLVIDTTNPIADAPPENGVLKYFTTMNRSLMEILQEKFPTAHFVKAFNSVGNAVMVNPSFKEGKPSMFIAGNDSEAKKTVSTILDQFGWEIEDLGVAAAARAIEPLCILWCAPGFLRNDWFHAYKVLR